MTRSDDLFRTAQSLIPGGVNSPVRAFRSVGSTPPFIARADGSRIWDVDGNCHIDFVGSWGPMILGHSPAEVIDRIRSALRNGTSYGAPCEWEVDLAERIVRSVPSVEMVRLVNSGTEAAMSAVRLARAYTGRDKIIKFAGCYHGHADSFLIAAGSGAQTIGVPSSPGVTENQAADTLVAEYNDLDSVERCFAVHSDRIAAVIVEPIAGNMGLVLPRKGFLGGLRRIASAHAALLVFDEVITGFRVGPGGAQGLYGIEPDLTILGKIIGGGFPVGAFGGPRRIMRLLAPEGPVYQAGTLSGNPIAMQAGCETLRILTDSGEEVYDRLEWLGERLERGIRKNLEDLGLALHFARIGSAGCLFFATGPIRNLPDVQRCDTEAYGRYFRSMLRRGIYLPPSQFETFFWSTAHTEQDIDQMVVANRESLAEVCER